MSAKRAAKAEKATRARTFEGDATVLVGGTKYDTAAGRVAVSDTVKLLEVLIARIGAPDLADES